MDRGKQLKAARHAASRKAKSKKIRKRMLAMEQAQLDRMKDDEIYALARKSGLIGDARPLLRKYQS